VYEIQDRSVRENEERGGSIGEREDRAARTSTALKVAMLQGRCNIRDQIHHAGGFNAPWGDLFFWVARFWDPGVS
jgi:hypothetical protein